MQRAMRLLAILSAISVVSSARTKDNGRAPCSTTYSIVQEDRLGNVQQGLSSPKSVKWANRDLERKYPDVCYAAPDPSVKTVFVITVAPATYHGIRVVTNSETTPTSGTVTDMSTGETANYQGTQTSTSSTTVPYSFEYGQYLLTVETFGDGGKPIVRRRFEQNGIYHTLYGVPIGGRGHHPAKALIEDAVKWIHGGGLQDPGQSVR